MASGTTVFQSATPATPPAGLPIMADSVNDIDHGAGTTQYVKIMDAATGGTAKAGVTAANGLSVDVTRVQGTVQALGSVQGVGTFQVLGSVQTVGTSQVLGSVQTVGTSQALGTIQPLAGSVHVANTAAVLGSVSAQGYSAHDSAMVGNPVLLAGYGSSGTQAAAHDGSVTRLWTDLNGRLQVRGTIETVFGTVQVLGSVQTVGTSQVLGSVQTVGTSQVLGSVQTVGTSQVLGSVQTVGTSQALGTVQPLAGSVHLAAGSVNAQGVIAHGAAIAGNPLLVGGFGSSGTQAAVADGQLARAAFDLNGRQIVKGTIESVLGTVQVLGSVQTVGTSQALGSVQTVGTSQVLGSVQTVGTSQALGSLSVQGYTAAGGGTVNPVQVGGVAYKTRPGTTTVGSAVQSYYDLMGRQVVQVGAGTTEPFGTMFGGVGANGTVYAGGGAGSYMRIYDIVVSGSAQGTFILQENTTIRWGPLFIAANGGWSFNSATGVKLVAANAALVAAFSAGTWSVFINYGLEGA